MAGSWDCSSRTIPGHRRAGRPGACAGLAGVGREPPDRQCRAQRPQRLPALRRLDPDPSISVRGADPARRADARSGPQQASGAIPWSQAHVGCMVAAVGTSALFLACYLYYHARAGSMPFAQGGLLRDRLLLDPPLTHPPRDPLRPPHPDHRPPGLGRPARSSRLHRLVDPADLAVRRRHRRRYLRPALSPTAAPVRRVTRPVIATSRRRETTGHTATVGMAAALGEGRRIAELFAISGRFTDCFDRIHRILARCPV